MFLITRGKISKNSSELPLSAKNSGTNEDNEDKLIILIYDHVLFVLNEEFHVQFDDYKA